IPPPGSAAARDKGEGNAGDTNGRGRRVQGAVGAVFSFEEGKRGKTRRAPLTSQNARKKKTVESIAASCGADPDILHERNSTALLKEGDGVVYSAVPKYKQSRLGVLLQHPLYSPHVVCCRFVCCVRLRRGWM
ncbi:protein G7, partial [Trypanosoma cruzi]